MVKVQSMTYALSTVSHRIQYAFTKNGTVSELKRNVVCKRISLYRRAVHNNIQTVCGVNIVTK